MRIKFLVALIYKITVVWDVKLYVVHSINISDEPTAAISNLHHLYPEDGRYRIFCTLKTEAAGSCET